ncbi:MAG: tRNA lysidine(34) synthetase TilS [Muribaculaceae bacterium]|nr:tRNA lysidine(34) synthetase TilS [Muribaculaceae bacterium]
MSKATCKLEKSVSSILKKFCVKNLLVAISGGADSVALLTACCRIAPLLKIRIEAVNCNFHLRGEESERDSQFTSRVCQSLGVRLHALDYDVDNFLRKHPSMSIEMACRDLRYSDFYRIIKDEGFDRVAVAHNSDDDIETMILNMLRGSGSRGLKGMDWDNGKVIRPLLGITRKEIESYLQCLGMEYIVDSSNLKSEFRRNFIRREVIPLLEERWTGARKSLSKTVGIMKEESSIIEDFYHKQLEKFCPEENTLLVYSEGITLGTVLRFLEKFGGNAEIAEEIVDSLHKDFKDRTWILSERYKAILERDRLIIADSEKGNEAPQFIWCQLDLTPAIMTELKGNRDQNIVYLPSDLSAYTLRLVKTGDRMSPLGMKGSRLVSDIISDARLSHKQKALIRVLERNSDGKIIWVSGLKRSRYDLISEDSKHCYRLSYLPNEPTSNR